LIIWLGKVTLHLYSQGFCDEIFDIHIVEGILQGVPISFFFSQVRSQIVSYNIVSFLEIHVSIRYYPFIIFIY